MTRYLPLLIALPLSACGLQLPELGRGAQSAPEADPALVLVASQETPRPDARPGVADGGSVVAVDGVLGTTLATLGDASVGGLWIETSLVQTMQRGRVTAENGASVELDLIPTGGIIGSGSRLSLQAMQALGLPLTAIAEVTVETL